MNQTSLRAARRTRRTRAAVLALALALGLGLAPLSAVAKSGSPPGARHAAAPARTVDVMTRNLYLGADLNPVIAALASGDPAAVVGAATQTWATVQASQPEARMAAVADEIAATRPAVIGLQEVTEWSTYAYDPVAGATVGEPTIVYDFLDLLLTALRARGVHYREVAGATAHNFTSPPIPVLAGEAYPTAAVKLADRDVILRRAGVRVGNAHSGNYVTILGPPAAPLEVARGWGSVDVRSRLATFRFVNTHFEAFGPEVLRVAQAAELFAAQDAIAASSRRLPQVYVGDFNTPAPDGEGYLALTSRLKDAWIGANGSAPGYTCCQNDLLSNPVSELTSRIDLVLTSRWVRATRARLVGDEPVDLPGDVWWPSDHAGVVARLVIR